VKLLSLFHPPLSYACVYRHTRGHGGERGKEVYRKREMLFFIISMALFLPAFAQTSFTSLRGKKGEVGEISPVIDAELPAISRTSFTGFCPVSLILWERR
jgi:hypothetical protein